MATRPPCGGSGKWTLTLRSRRGALTCCAFRRSTRLNIDFAVRARFSVWRRITSASRLRRLISASCRRASDVTSLPQDSFELLASPPSPHGWRLQQAISLGSVTAQITSFEKSAGRIVSARAADRTFRADAFILATGLHIGGGLNGGRVTGEPLLNLGVFHEGRPVRDVGTRLQHLQYLDPAEELRSGLSTDKRLHPLDEEGNVPYANLFAAGAVLGGYEYAGPCGFGVPILTGWLAGHWAARKD